MTKSKKNILLLLISCFITYANGISKPLSFTDVIMQYLIDFSNDDYVFAIYFHETTKVFDIIKPTKNLKKY